MLLTNQYDVLTGIHESLSALKTDEKILENVYKVELISALVPLLQLLFKVTIKNSFLQVGINLNAGRYHCLLQIKQN